MVSGLEQALVDPLTTDDALAALGAVPAKHRRRILASFGALHGLVRIHVAQKEEVEATRCPRCGF